MDTIKLWSGYDPHTYKQNPRCLPVDTILAGKYLVGPVLGQGGFGITYQGYDLNMETRVAIKEYFPVELVSRNTTAMENMGERALSLSSMSGEKSLTYQQGLKKYVAEAQNVSQFSENPGVVSVKDFFYENETAYIVMEYIEGQSLKDYLKEKGERLSEEETLRIMRPVLEALKQVHSAGIIHRDISPDNIMLTFDAEKQIKEVKLIDFGAARMTAKNDQKSLTIILKHGYAPEEQYRTHGEQGPWTDVYAVCAVMYRMLTGETPVPAMDRMFQDSLKSFEACQVKVTKSTAEAILHGMAVKKEDRIPSMEVLLEALYEGKRVKTPKPGDKNRKKAAGLIAAAVIVLAVGGIAVGKMAGNAGKMSSSPSADGEKLTNGKDLGEENADGQSKALENSPATELSLDKSEEAFGDVIVTASPQTSYDGSKTHVVILQEDGTVTSVGSNQYGQSDLSDWTRIAAVAAGDTFTAGLREDGRVVIAGTLEGKEDVERWEHIVELADSHSYLYGLTADGTVVANVVDDKNAALLEWTGIKTITGGSVGLCALTEDGRVLSCGRNLTPVEINGWEDVDFLSTNNSMVFGVREDGTVRYSLIWQEYDDVEEYGAWVKEISGIENFQNIIQIYSDFHRIYSDYVGCFGVSEDGSLHMAGWIPLDNKTESDFISEIKTWSNLAGIIGTSYGNRIIGIQKDGTILKAAELYQNASPETMTNLKKIIYLDGLAYRNSSLIGITQDGRFLFQSYNDEMPSLADCGLIQDVGEMKYYVSDDLSFTGFAYFDTDGKLWMQDPKKHHRMVVVNESPLLQVSFLRGNSESNIYYAAGLGEDHRIRLYSTSALQIPMTLFKAEDWTEIEQVVCYSGHSNTASAIAALKSDGTVCQIGSDETMVSDTSDWTDIVSLWQGNFALGGIRRDGTAVFIEDSPEYNYGQYNTYDWTDLTQLALGLYHTVGLRSDGTIYAVGRNDAGQCEVEDWKNIVFIAAGENCTLGVTSDGSLMVAGEIGW